MKNFKATKTLFCGLAVLALSSAAFAIQPVGGTFNLENSGRIQSSISTYSSVNGTGSSLSHAEGTAGATANGTVTNPLMQGTVGTVSVTGDISGYNTGMAYNVSTGSGHGAASSTGWSDATLTGNSSTGTALSVPGGVISGTLEVSGIADGGMQNNVRNGTDINIRAGTSQDGFVGAMYNGGFAISGSIPAVGIAGGASLQGNVQSTQYSHGEVVAGGVTFSDGTPSGQTAAVRSGNSGVMVNTSGSFNDPVQ